MFETNIWNVITTYYITSPVWLTLTILALIYLVYISDKDGRKKILLCLIFLIFTILNELSYHFWIKIFDKASYYRFLWVFPYVMIVAYALVKCVQNLIYKKERGIACLLVLSVVGILFMTNGNMLQRLHDGFPQNKYGVLDDMLELRDLLSQERMGRTDRDRMVLACPETVMLQYQTLDAGCQIVTNRFIYVDIRNYGADVSRCNQAVQDAYLLSTICQDNARPDVLVAKDAMERQAIDYIIVDANAGMEDYVESLGCSLVGGTTSYLVYENDATK